MPQEGGRILNASEHGYGKQSRVEDYPLRGRGGKGVISMQMSERNGALVGAVQVFEGDEAILISDQGTLVRTRTDEVSILGRNTQGVTLIKVQEGEKLVQVARVAESVSDDEELAADDQTLDTEGATVEPQAETNPTAEGEAEHE